MQALRMFNLFSIFHSTRVFLLIHMILRRNEKKELANFNPEMNKTTAEKYKWADWGTADLNWFLETLTLIPEIPTSLKLKILETALFDQGSPVCIIKMQGMRKVVKITNPYMNKTFILKNFNRDYLIPTKIKTKSETHIINSHSKGACSINKTTTFVKTKYKAILRLALRNEYSRYKTVLLTEKMMNDILVKLTKEKMKNVKGFSAYIKSSEEASSSIIRIKYAPYLCHKKPTLILTPRTIQKNPEKYDTHHCNEIIMKLCELIKSSCQIEILELCAEFYVIDGFYWLFDVWQIVFRKCTTDEPIITKSVRNADTAENRLKFVMNDEKDENMKNRLIKHGENAATLVYYVNPLMGYINVHVNKMKHSLGIDTNLSPPNPDLTSNEIFKKLHPGCPFEFLSLLNKKCCPIRSDPKILKNPKCIFFSLSQK